MNEFYCIKIRGESDEVFPSQFGYSAYKDELYISQKGRVAGLFGSAELMAFATPELAQLYIDRNKPHFERLYGNVQLTTVWHCTAT